MLYRTICLWHFVSNNWPLKNSSPAFHIYTPIRLPIFFHRLMKDRYLLFKLGLIYLLFDQIYVYCLKRHKKKLMKLLGQIRQIISSNYGLSHFLHPHKCKLISFWPRKWKEKNQIQ